MRTDPYGLPGVYLPDRPPAGRIFSTSLDDLPLPEPELWLPTAPESRELWIPVQGKRGCPMGCSFCATKSIEGTRIRRRSPESIAQWMERVAARGFRNFCTVDNTFNIPPSYAKGYCREIIRRGLDINLWCIVYPEVGRSRTGGTDGESRMPGGQPGLRKRVGLCADAVPQEVPGRGGADHRGNLPGCRYPAHGLSDAGRAG